MKSPFELKDMFIFFINKILFRWRVRPLAGPVKINLHLEILDFSETEVAKKEQGRRSVP